ncbi:SufB/SufD family protein [Miniphocaeibacter massiliensis]|uniref:SufB/SufD family protein n=1 Tax=Miniphocaeibacter massiliensis TaxID=2041841 RepID=UPI000C1C639C|nr:SufD family Fe-S cluster assembly protein [Miniphocaeibacter massiliensis]
MTIYNELPVTTFRWTKANSITLDDFDVKYNFYAHEVVKTGKEYVLDRQQFNEIELPKDFVGASKESLKEVIDRANYKRYIHGKSGEKLDIYLDFKVEEKNPTLIGDISIYAEENSEIQIIMDYSGDFKEAYTNVLSRVFAEKNSKITIVKVQRQGEIRHIEHRYSKLEENAKVDYLMINIGGNESLYHFVTDLKGDNSDADLKAIYIGENSSITDIYNNIRFYGKNAKGNFIVKGALKDRAKKYFRGTLDYIKGCSGSTGDEQENVILLNDKVKSFAIPILLAGEDDVMGNHAASAGQVDESILFYIMSRGFSEQEAKRMIVEASFRPIVDEIKNEELKKFVLDSLDSKLETV